MRCAAQCASTSARGCVWRGCGRAESAEAGRSQQMPPGSPNEAASPARHRHVNRLLTASALEQLAPPISHWFCSILTRPFERVVSKNCADFELAIERWFAGSSAANRTAPSARTTQPHYGDPVMEESVHGEYRLSLLDHRYNERNTALCWYGVTATLRSTPQTR